MVQFFSSIQLSECQIMQIYFPIETNEGWIEVVFAAVKPSVLVGRKSKKRRARLNCCWRTAQASSIASAIKHI
jgi:hypothetical protein